MKTLRNIIRWAQEIAMSFLLVIFIDQTLYDAIDGWYGLDEMWQYYVISIAVFIIIKLIDFIIQKEKEIELI